MEADSGPVNFSLPASESSGRDAAEQCGLLTVGLTGRCRSAVVGHGPVFC